MYVYHVFSVLQVECDLWLIEYSQLIISQ